MAKVEPDFSKAEKDAAADRERTGLAPQPVNPPGSHSPDRVTLAMDSISDYYKPGDEAAPQPAPAPDAPTDYHAGDGEEGQVWP
jgi:hypothetical protein